VNDAVDLVEPSTVHGNGAELAWSRYAGTAPFQRYEVHRSSSRTFSPDQSTLLTTISDPASTSYRDTTASGGKTFTYRVVANTDASVPRTVTLPPDGQARTLIQPDPAAGQHTFLTCRPPARTAPATARTMRPGWVRCRTRSTATCSSSTCGRSRRTPTSPAPRHRCGRSAARVCRSQWRRTGSPGPGRRHRARHLRRRRGDLVRDAERPGLVDPGRGLRRRGRGQRVGVVHVLDPREVKLEAADHALVQRLAAK
jgi:hypothetical protein